MKGTKVSWRDHAAARVAAALLVDPDRVQVDALLAQEAYGIADALVSEARAGHPLRDYFATEALVGLVTDLAIHLTPAMAAQEAYDIADAMMREREEP